MIVPTVVHGIEITGVSDGQEQRFIDAFTVEYAATADDFRSYVDNRGVIKVNTCMTYRKYIYRCSYCYTNHIQRKR